MHRCLIDVLQFKKQIKAEEIHIQEQNKPRTAAFISQYITLFKILLQFITLHNISKCFYWFYMLISNPSCVFYKI